ncbi:DUF3265 domain-containing protein [Vibrio sp. LaRot3]|nr:DUF3265 domain-containing protein [Vibrio sp. LaRot3]MDA0148438.1 DUF3265 domain-containing protein [Vibrio sp. LaRot3]
MPSERHNKATRVIRNAWHFCYVLRLVFKLACESIRISLITT